MSNRVRDFQAPALALLLRAEALEREVKDLRKAMKENIGDAYNLLTQGESPTQRRQPAAQRIYDRSKAAIGDANPPRNEEDGPDA